VLQAEMWTRYFVNALPVEILCSEKWILDVSLPFDYGTQSLLLLKLLENVPSFLLNSTCRLTVWIWSSRTYIGFGVLASEYVWGRAEGLMKRGARNARDSFVRISLRSRQWQNATTRQHIASIQWRLSLIQNITIRGPSCRRSTCDTI
jgi:hypothetical protein